MRISRALASITAIAVMGCGSDLSGLKSEDEYPYDVNLIFELEQDASLQCLQSANPCPVRLKGNITSRWDQRVPGAQIYARTAQASEFTPLVKANLSGIFNLTVTLEKTAAGRGITLCAGETLAIALEGRCAAIGLP